MLCLVCFKGALDTRHFTMDPSFGRWGESVALRLIGFVPRAYDDDSEGDKSELFW